MNISPILRFWSKVNKTETCWLWTSAVIRRYGIFSVGSRKVRAHRYVWEITNGPIPEGLFVCHTCDTPLCVRPDHLFLGTAADNAKDAVSKGRSATGDRNGSRRYPERLRGDNNHAHRHPERMARGRANGWAKLTDEQVREIRSRYQPGVYGAGMALCREFGINPSHLWRIVKRQVWAHV